MSEYRHLLAPSPYHALWAALVRLGLASLHNCDVALLEVQHEGSRR